MSLTVLVLVVVAGIATIILAVHLTGGSRTNEFTVPQTAKERFAVDFPEAEILTCHLTADHHDAVLELKDGHVGLVHAIGSMALTRFVAAGEMQARVNEADPSAMDLKTGDLTWPRAHFAFDDPDEAARVASLFARGSLAGREQAA